MMTSSSSDEVEEEKPFLQDVDLDLDLDLTPRKPVSTDRSTGRATWLCSSVAIASLAAHGILLLLFWATPGSKTASPWPRQAPGPNLYSPFENVTRTRIEIWPDDAWDHSPFAGPPSRALDEAWDKLQAVAGISVTPQEAAQVNLTSSIMLKNGHQATIVGYYHNLHCLRYLYQGLHPELYVRTGGFSHAGNEHSYHCIEVLRRSVLCNPDLTLHAIHWQDEQKLGMDLESQSTRQCVDFDAIYDFSMTRKFPRDMIVDADVDVVQKG